MARYGLDQIKRCWWRSFVIALLSSLLASSCSDNAGKSGGIFLKVVKGGGQETPPGKPYAESIVIQAIDKASGNPIPKLAITFKQVTEGDGLSYLNFGVINTNEQGIVTNTANGGERPSLVTEFHAATDDQSAIVKFSLATMAGSEAIPASIDSSSENDVRISDDASSATRNLDPETITETTTEIQREITVEREVVEEITEILLPNDGNKANRLVLATEHNDKETAGVPFGLVLKAVTETGALADFSGSYELKFTLHQKIPGEQVDRLLINADFEPFEPKRPTDGTYTFVNGQTVIPTELGVEIRKTVPNLYIQVIATPTNSAEPSAVTGTSQTLTILPARVESLEIHATADIRSVIKAGERVLGEAFKPVATIPAEFEIVPSLTPAQISINPPITLSIGTSLLLEAVGFDRFGNQFAESLESNWTGIDIHNVESGVLRPLPSEKVMQNGLGRESPSAVMVFTPQQETVGFLQALHRGKRDDGTDFEIVARTGAFRINSDKPTTFIVDAFAEMADGSTPDANANALSKLTAGQDVWLRVTAANSAGVRYETWNEVSTLTLTFGGVRRSAGWPLAEDATDDAPTKNNLLGVFAEKPMVEDVQGRMTYHSFVKNVKFEEGRAWLRTSDGLDLEFVDYSALSLLKATFYRASDIPSVRVTDPARSISGYTTLPEVVAAEKQHIKIGFTSSVTLIPVKYKDTYPEGINEGTTLRDWTTKVGDSTTFGSYAFDQYGNRLGLTSGRWDGIPDLPDFFLANYSEPAATKTLLPRDVVQRGQIRVTDVASPTLEDFSGNIEVLPGLPAYFKIEMTKQPIAGQSVGYTIKAYDSSDNLAVDFNGDFDLMMRLTGASELPKEEWFTSKESFEEHVKLMAEYTSGRAMTLKFDAGEASIMDLAPTALRFFFTQETPVLATQTLDQSISGTSAPINILPEKLASLAAHFQNSLAVDDNGTVHNYLKDAVVQDVILTSVDMLKMEVRGYDRYANPRGPVASNWTPTKDDDKAATPAIANADFNGKTEFFVVQDDALLWYQAREKGKTYLRFEARTDVCATAGACEPSLKPGFTGIIDAHVGTPSRVRVVPLDPKNPPHIAGEAFAMKVQVLDEAGQRVDKFNGEIEVTSIMVDHLETLSRTGHAAEEPDPARVLMVNGEGILSGFKNFSIYDSPRINVKARLTSGKILDNTGGASVPQNITAAEKYYIRVISAPGFGDVPNGPKHKPTIYSHENIIMSGTERLALFPTSNLEIFAGYFDRFGNWVGDAKVSWSSPDNCKGVQPDPYVNSLLGKLGTVSDNKTRISGDTTPIPTGQGCVRMTEVAQSLPVVGNREYLLNDIEISEGEPDRLRLAIISGYVDSDLNKPIMAVQNDQNGNFERIEPVDKNGVKSKFEILANKPFTLRMEVLDQGGRVVNQITRTVPFKLALPGATVSDVCPSHDTPQTVRYTKTIADLANALNITGIDLPSPANILKIVAGKVEPGDNIAGYERSGYFVVPKAQKFNLAASFMYDYGDGRPLKELKGLLKDLQSVPGPLERVNLRSEPSGRGELHSLAKPLIIKADKGANLYAAGYDNSCNYRSDESSLWTATSVLEGTLVGDAAAGANIFVQPKKEGLGRVTAKANGLNGCQLADGCDGEVDIKVEAGSVAKLMVETQNKNQERATVPFALTIKALDQFDNSVTDFAGAKELSFAWDAGSGPNTTYLPYKPNDKTSYTFVAGVLDQGVANFPEGDDTRRLKAALAGKAVNLTVTHVLADSTSITGATQFTVTPGPATNVDLYLEENDVPKLVTTPPNLQLKSESSYFFFSKLLDDAGNEISGKVIDWQVTGALSPQNLNKTQGATVIVTPNTTGLARLSAVHQRRGDLAKPDGDISEDADVEIVPGNIDAFEVSPIYYKKSIDLSDLDKDDTFVFEDAPSSIDNFQRVAIPFSLRLRAVDKTGNLVKTYCNGHQDPVNTANICEVTVVYESIPSVGPDGSIPAPANAVRLKVRWNQGYGAFVDPNDASVAIKPFNFRRAGEQVAITLVEAAGRARGTTKAFPIKSGLLDDIVFRDRISDTASAGKVYKSVSKDLPEGGSMPIVAAGYDAADNYIRDVVGNWVASNQNITLAPTATDRFDVNVMGMKAGLVDLVFSSLQSGEDPAKSATLNLDVQPSIAQSFVLQLVDAQGAPVFMDLDNDSIATDVAVQAGDEFFVKVTAMTGLAGSGVVASTFTQLRSLDIETVGTKPSDLAFEWQRPKPDANASEWNFDAGVAMLRNIVFTGIPVERGDLIKVIVSHTGSAITGSIEIKNTLGKPGHLRVLNNAQHSMPAIIPNEASFEFERVVPLFAHLYDKGGNRIGPAASAIWSFQGMLPPAPLSPIAIFVDPTNGGQNVFSVSAKPDVSLNPKDLIEAKTGVLTIAQNDLTWTVKDLSVVGTEPVRFALIPESAGSWTATQCYNLTVEARTISDQVAITYKGGKTLDWTLTLADGTPYPTLIDNLNNPPSKDIVSLADGIYTFGEGIYNSTDGAFCIRDATGLNGQKVRLHVKDNSTPKVIEGFFDLDVKPGPAALYGLYPRITEAMPVCGLQTVRATSTATNYWLHETDAVGNFLRSMPARWIGNDALAMAGVTQDDPLGHVILTMNKTGSGYLNYGLLADPVGTRKALACEPTFKILPGPAKKLFVENRGGQSGEVATEPFHVTARLLDEFDNLQNELSETIPLRVQSNAENSPSGQAPVTLAVAASKDQTVDAVFVKGVWQSAADAFLVPKAGKVTLTTSSTVPGGSFVKNGVALIHKDGLSSMELRDLPVRPGKPETVQIRDGHATDASLIDEAWAALLDNELSTVGEYLFYAASADRFHNYVAPLKEVDWLAVNGMPPAITAKTNTSVAVYDAVESGSGKLRINSKATSGDLQGKYYETAQLTVVSAPATAWRVRVWSQDAEITQVTAGQHFKIQVAAVDEGGATDTNFVGAKKVVVKMLGISPAPIPFQEKYLPAINCSDSEACAPTGQLQDGISKEFTVDFVNGVGYLDQVVMFNANDVFTAEIKSGAGTQDLLAGLTKETDVLPGPFESPLVRYPSGTGNAPYTINADKPLPMELIGIDHYGNNYGHLAASVAVDFTGIDDYDGYAPTAPNVQDQFTGTLEPATINATTTITIFSPIRVGNGRFTFTCTDAICRSANGGSDIIYTTAQVTIDPGPAVRLHVNVEGPDEEFVFDAVPFTRQHFKDKFNWKAAELFDIRVAAIDIHSNIVKTFTNAGNAALEFAFDLDGDGFGEDDEVELTSPAGNKPAFADVSISSFTSGEWVSRLDASSRFKLTKAGKHPYLTVRVGNLVGRSKERLTVDPGDIGNLRLNSQAGNTGTVYKTCAEDQPKIGSGINSSLHATAFDIELNYIGNETAVWDIPVHPTVDEAEIEDTIRKKLQVYDAVDKAWPKSTSKDFAPGVLGSWKIDAISTTNSLVKTDLCVVVDNEAASQLKAFVVLDKDGNGTIDTGSGEVNRRDLGENGQFIQAGECFSFEIRVTDPAGNLVSTFNETLTVNFVPNAQASAAGFTPIPSSAISMDLLFKNGIAYTPPIRPSSDPLTHPHGQHPLFANGHRCTETGKMGSFALMKESTSSSIIVSAIIGGSNALTEAKIRTDRGPVDFVAMSAGLGTGNDVIIGVSQKADQVGLDLTNPANFTDAYKCSSQNPAAHEICIKDLVDNELKQYQAGVLPEERFARFQLGSYDAGGNLLDRPLGDFTSNYVTLGHVAKDDPQFQGLDPNLWFAQYVVVNGNYQTLRAVEDPGIAATNKIYYYPLKSGKGRRLSARNVVAGGKTFVITNRYGINVAPAPFDHITVDLDKPYYLAGERPEIKVNFFDKFNNKYWVNDAIFNIGVYRADDTGFLTNLDDGNRFRLPLTGATESLGGQASKTYPSTVSQVKTAGSWKLRVSATTDGKASNVVSDLPVFSNIPVAQMLVRGGAPHTYATKDGNECVFKAKVGQDSTWAFGAYDNFGNFVSYVPHGWVAVSGSDTGKKVFTDLIEVNYLDQTLTATPPTLSNDWNFSYAVRLKPKKARAGDFVGSDDTLMGRTTSTFTINAPSHPTLNGQNWSTTLPWGHGSDTPDFCLKDILNIEAAEPAKIALSLESNGGSPKLGDMFSTRVLFFDDFDNPAHLEVGATANFSFKFAEGTAMDAPDMCAIIGLSPVDCINQRAASVTWEAATGTPSFQREWQAAANLDDQIIGLSADVKSSGIALTAFADTQKIFRQVNNRIDPLLTVCFDSSTSDAEKVKWGKLPGSGTPVCSEPYGIRLNATQYIEVFVTSEPASGIFYGGLVDETILAPIESRKFSTTKYPMRFHVYQFDKFGNFSIIPQVAGLWTAVEEWEIGGTIAAPGKFVTQFENWNIGSPLSMKKDNRLPVEGRFQVTYSGMRTKPFTLLQADAPPGEVAVTLYRTDRSTLIDEGGDVDVGEQLYFTLQLKDQSGANLLWKTEEGTPMPVSFSSSGIEHNLYPTQEKISLPAAASFKFCNGFAVKDTYDLSACSPTGASPATSDLLFFPTTFYSSHGTDPRIVVNFNQPVKEVANIGGRSKPINLRPGPHNNYVLRLAGTGSPPFFLDQQLEYIGASPEVNVYASDTFGNHTTRDIPDTEQTVQLQVVGLSGFANGQLCQEGKTVAECQMEIFFRCGLAEDGAFAAVNAGNCLDHKLDMKARKGFAKLVNVVIDSPGSDYYIVASSTDQSGKSTFDRNLINNFDPTAVSELQRQIKQRAANMEVLCTRDCISRFDLVYNANVSVGDPLTVDIKMVDYRGRLLGDGSLSSLVSNQNVIWSESMDPDNAANLVNGGAPENRKASGFCPNKDLAAKNSQPIPVDCKLQFTGGIATTKVTINRVNQPISKDKFTFTVTNIPGIKAVAPTDLWVLPTPARRYRIVALDGAGIERPAPQNLKITQNADPQSPFKVEIWSIDGGGNFVDSPKNIELEPEFVSGIYTNVGNFEGTTSCSVNSGKCALDNVYMRVGNKVKLRVKGPTDPLNSPERLEVDFKVTGGTVSNFVWESPEVVKAWGGLVVNGNSGTSAKIIALDGADNRLDKDNAQAANAALHTFLGNVAITSRINQSGFADQKVCTDTDPSDAGSRDGKFVWANATTTCFYEVEERGIMEQANLTMTMPLHGVPVTRAPISTSSNPINVQVIPNDPYHLRICAGQPANDVGCASTMAEHAIKADGAEHKYTVFSYDYYQNLRGAEGGTLTVQESSPTMSPGSSNKDDFMFESSGGVLTFKPRNAETPGTYIIAKATRPITGIPDVTMKINFVPGDLAKIDAFNYTATSLTDAVRAEDNNFKVRDVKLYYIVDGNPWVKSDVTAALSLATLGSGLNSTIPETLPCNFVNGICTSATDMPAVIQLSLLKPELEGRLRLNVSHEGKTAFVDIEPIYIDANVPVDFVVTFTPPQPVAGEDFTMTVQGVDAFGNWSESNCRGNLVNNGLNFYSERTASSPGGWDAPPENANLPAILNNAELPDPGAPKGDPNYGKFTTTGNKIFASGFQRVVFTACGHPPESFERTVEVLPGPLNSIFLNDKGSSPGQLEAHQTFSECHSRHAYDAVNPLNVNEKYGDANATLCKVVRAYFYDIYGNRYDPTVSACTGWQFTPWQSAQMSTGAVGTSVQLGHGYQVAHNEFIDGTLTCNKETKSRTIHLYGGVKAIGFKFDETKPDVLDAASKTFRASFDNFYVNEIVIYRSKEGALDVDTTRNTPERIHFASTSFSYIATSDASLSAQQKATRSAHLAPYGFGISANPFVTCTFVAGKCTTGVPFDFLIAETSKSLTLRIRQKTYTMDNINVRAGPPDSLYLHTLGDLTKKLHDPTAWNIPNLNARISGHPVVKTGKHIPVDLWVIDRFGNLTDDGTCKDAKMAINVLGNTIPPCAVDGACPVGVETDAVIPVNTIGNAPTGHFLSNQATSLFSLVAINVPPEQDMQFSACGLGPLTATVTVDAGDIDHITLVDDDTKIPKWSDPQVLTEKACINNETKWWLNETQCPEIFAYMFDKYGNRARQRKAPNVVTADNKPSWCDAWSYTSKSSYAGAATQSQLCESWYHYYGRCNNNAYLNTPSHGKDFLSVNHFVDGELVCNAGGVNSPPVLMWGGLSHVEASYAYLNQLDDRYEDAKRTLLADFNNMAVREIKIFNSKNGVKTQASYTGNKSLVFKSDSASAGSGGETNWQNVMCRTDFSVCGLGYVTCPSGTKFGGSGCRTNYNMQAEPYTWSGLITNPGACRFENGVCTAPIAGRSGTFTNASPLYLSWIAREDDRYLEVYINRVKSRLDDIDVLPGPIDHMDIENWPTIAVAGEQVGTDVKVILKDRFNNHTQSLCENGDLDISGGTVSRGKHGTQPTAPITPDLTAFSATYGEWHLKGATNAIKLFDARRGTNVRPNPSSGESSVNNSPQTVTFTACKSSGYKKAPLIATKTVTVNHAQCSKIYISDEPINTGEPEEQPPTDVISVPGNPARVDVVAYCYDAYGNWVSYADADQFQHYSGFTCNWTYESDTGYDVPPNPAVVTPPSGASLSKNITVSDIDGPVRGVATCKREKGEASIALFAPYALSPSFACEPWSCGLDGPQSICTVVNDTGYRIEEFAFTGFDTSLKVDSTYVPEAPFQSCEAGNLAANTACKYRILGTSGSPSKALILNSTPEAAALGNENIGFVTANARISGGTTPAPACTNKVSMAYLTSPSWQCLGPNQDDSVPAQSLTGLGVTKIRVTNDEAVDAVFTTPNSQIFLDPIGPFVIEKNDCATGIAANSFCDIEIRTSKANISQSLVVAPDGVFSMNSFNISPSPNCTRGLTDLPAQITQQCSGPLGSKVLTFTARNDNSFMTATLKPIATGTLVDDDRGRVTSTTGCDANLLPGETCSVSVQYDTTLATSDTNVTIKLADQGNDFFNDGLGDAAWGATDADNSCASYDAQLTVLETCTSGVEGRKKVGIKITNNAPEVLEIAYPTSAGTDGATSVTGCQGASLNQGQSCDIVATYEPPPEVNSLNIKLIINKSLNAFYTEDINIFAQDMVTNTCHD